MKVGIKHVDDVTDSVLFRAGWFTARLVFRMWRRFPKSVGSVVLAGVGGWRFGAPDGFAVGFALPVGLFVWRLSLVSHQGSALVGLSGRIRAVHRIAQIKRRWYSVCLKSKLTGTVDREPPTIGVIRAHGEAIRGVIDLGGSGLTIADVRNCAGRIVSSMGCRSVRITDGEWPSECEIEFRWSDPLRSVVELDQLEVMEDQSLVSVGLTEDIDQATIDIRLSALMIGQSGSGKSSLAWAMLAGFQRQAIPVRLRVIDPAGGVELAALAQAGEWVWTTRSTEAPDGQAIIRYMGQARKVHGPALPTGGPPRAISGDKSALRVCGPCLRGDRLAFHVHAYTDRIKEAEIITKGWRDAMDARLRGMKSRKHSPTLEEPHDLLIIDEMLLCGDILKGGATGDLGQGLAIGRKAAFTCLGLSQLPQKETLGQVRDLFPQRLCLATRNREQTDITLGQGASAEGARAHKIPISMPGVGYLYVEGRREYVRFRGAVVDDPTADMIAIGAFALTADDAADDRADGAAHSSDTTSAAPENVAI